MSTCCSDQKRISIRRSLSNNIAPDVASSARMVFNNHRLSKLEGEFASNRSRNSVRGSPCRKRNDQCYSPPLMSWLALFKTASARLTRNRFAEHTTKFYSKPLFWHRAYFVGSVGSSTLETVRAYVNAQGSEEQARKSAAKANPTACARSPPDDSAHALMPLGNHTA